MSNKKILPEGYYTQEKANPYLVKLNQGSYKGLQIQICEKIKIRKDVLTSRPQICYDYRILHYASLNQRECETSKKLNSIIGAIVVELLSDQMENGTIESVDNPCLNPGSKISSLKT